MAEITSPAAPSTTPDAPAAETATASPAPDGGVTVGEVKTEPKVDVPIVSPEVQELNKKLGELEGKTRQYQADRDRAESYTKNLIKQVLPLVSMDEFGNIIGLRNQQPTPTINEIINRAALGDENALAQLVFAAKEQAKSEIRSELSQERSLSDAENQIKKDFPHIVGQNGDWNPESPVIHEAQKIVQQEFPGRFNVKDPAQLRAVIEMAEARIIKQNFPDIEQRIKNEVLKKTQQSGSVITGIPASGVETKDDLSGLTTEQIARVQKEGAKQEDLARIAKMVKQAQKEGAFYL